MLTKNNANVNGKWRWRKEDGATALFKATQEGHANVCTVLLEYNGNVNEKTKDGATPLFQASQEGDNEVCTVFLKHNTNVNEKRQIAQHHYSKKRTMAMSTYVLCYLNTTQM